MINNAHNCLFFFLKYETTFLYPHFYIDKYTEVEILCMHVYIYICEWKFQDPKMEVLYHIRPYFVGIFPYIGLTYGRYLPFRNLKSPVKYIYIL